MTAPVFPDIPASISSPGSETKYRMLKAEFGDGYVQAAADGITPKSESWQLQWENQPLDDVEAIIAFLDERAGYQPFYWTPPHGSAASLYYCEQYGEAKVGPQSKTLTATFERWYGAEE